MASFVRTNPAFMLNLVIGYALFVLGCHPLDRVAQSIEAYGTISVSAPMLVPVERTKGFDFDLDKSADFYFSADGHGYDGWGKMIDTDSRKNGNGGGD